MMGHISEPYRALLEAAERRLLVSTLVLHAWDRRAAAEALGLPGAVLGARCRYFGLSSLHPHGRSTVIERPPLARRVGRPQRPSGTKLGAWRELPPPGPQAFPMSVYED